MTTEVGTVLEGTWEEIEERAGDLAGRRVIVTVLPPDAPALTEEQQEMLAAADRLQYGEFPPEERAALEGMETFLKSHRFSLRPPAYFEPEPSEGNSP